MLTSIPTTVKGFLPNPHFSDGDDGRDDHDRDHGRGHGDDGDGERLASPPTGD